MADSRALKCQGADFMSSEVIVYKNVWCMSYTYTIWRQFSHHKLSEENSQNQCGNKNAKYILQ